MTKILIVDDAKIMRNILRGIFKELGHHDIIEATNGQDAVESYKTNKPNVVTMDITMEKKDGVEAAREILNYDPEANVIMITALGQEKLLRECIQMGIRDYIVKPFTKERVISAVSKTVSMN